MSIPMSEGTETTTAMQRLTDLIRLEENGILATFVGEKRWAVLELARSMDYFFVRQMLVKQSRQSEEEKEASSIVPYGFSKALNLFIDASCCYAEAPLLESSPRMERWGNQVLLAVGYLGYCEQLLSMCRVGLAECVQSSADHYRFGIIVESAGAELIEREHIEWQQRKTRKDLKPHFQAQAKQTARIRRMMSERVMPAMTHYIQYTTSPEIDSFYRHDAALRAQEMLGRDAFTATAKFGSLDFNLYCQAVTLLMGWALRHLGFSDALLNKVPSLRARDVATIIIPIDRLSAEVAKALKIEIESARDILGCLTLAPQNKTRHCAISGNAVSPPLIQYGLRDVLVPIWGNLAHPYLFMLNELRWRFERDWFSRVNERERLFRDELYGLFNDDRFVTAPTNIRLKVAGTEITDIDAVVFDRISGELALFQLKCQDFFAGSLRERESRKSNILETGNQWIERVTNWVANTSPQELSRTFRVKNSDAISAVRLFMVGRNFAFFSGKGSPDLRAAWGMWYQILRRSKEISRAKNPLGGLWRHLQKDAPIRKAPPKIEAQRFSLGGVTIEIDAL